jgi:hypothetical protein
MKHVVTCEINAGEYHWDITIECEELTPTGPCSVRADGVEIAFEEDIVKIRSAGETRYARPYE